MMMMKGLGLSIDIARLGKLVNDQTRLNILRVLKEHGPMPYVDLMEAAGVTNTGRLNYHLKVLGDLVKKDGPEEWYALSDRGRIAIDFVDKFQTLTEGTGVGPMSIARIPFESTASILRITLALELVAIAFVGLYAYAISPGHVSLHYTLNGQAYSFAPSWIFLLLAALLNIPQLVFLGLSGWRYRWVNMYPYSLKIPGFHSNLAQLGYERRGYWINKLFSEILIVGIVVGAAMLYLIASIYESALLATVVSTYFCDSQPHRCQCRRRSSPLMRHEIFAAVGRRSERAKALVCHRLRLRPLLCEVRAICIGSEGAARQFNSSPIQQIAAIGCW